MWPLFLLIPLAAGAAYFKNKSDAAAAPPPPPPPLDAATYEAARQGVPAAVAAVQAQLDAQLASGQADQPTIEFPANTPEQDAQNAALASAQQASAAYQASAAADAKLQSALGGGMVAPTPEVIAARTEAAREKAIKDYSPGSFDPITGIPYSTLDTRTIAQKAYAAGRNTVTTLSNKTATRMAVRK